MCRSLLLALLSAAMPRVPCAPPIPSEPEPCEANAAYDPLAQYRIAALATGRNHEGVEL